MTIRLLPAIAGFLLLAGCGNPFAPAATPNGASTSNAAISGDATRVEDRARAAEAQAPAGGDAGKPTAETAPPAAARGLSETWFAGRWSDERDCSDPVDFRSDRSFILPTGGRGVWRLDPDGTLVLDGPGGSRRTRITRVSDDLVRTAEGASSYRCD